MFDTHWFTTFEHIVTAHERRIGHLHLRRAATRQPADAVRPPGRSRARRRHRRRRPTTATTPACIATDDPYIADPLPDGLPHALPAAERGAGSASASARPPCSTTSSSSVRCWRRPSGSCDRRVVLLASGGLSHRFWPLRELRDHEAAGPGAHLSAPRPAAADEQLIARLEAGRPCRRARGLPRLPQYSPEGLFAHYLMMVGALGGAACRMRGVRYSDYESAAGTGQVHLWFETANGGRLQMRLANHGGRATIVVSDGDGHDGDRRRAGQRRAIGQRPDAAEPTSRTIRRWPSSRPPPEPLRSDWPVLDESLLGAPVPRPPKGFGVALNYRQHAIESGRDLPTEPHLFGKTENCVCGPFDEIVVPAGRGTSRLRGRAGHRLRSHLQGGVRERRVELPRRRHVRAGHLRSRRAVPSAGQAVHHRQDVRHVRPHRPVPGHRRRAVRPRRARARGPAQRRGDAAREHQRPDLRRACPGRVAQPVHHVPAGRPRVDRYAGRCRRGADARFLRDGDVVETEIEGIGTMRNPVVER